MILTKIVTYRNKQIEVEKLKPNSEKRVLVRCDVCGDERMAYWKSIKVNQTCHKCANRIGNATIMVVGSKHNRLTVIENASTNRCICLCSCGSTKEYKNSSVRNGHTKSCGCLQKEMTSVQGKKIVGVWIGENHPNWKGGITSQRQLFNASKEAKEWRVNVFERDKYTCQKCGQVGGELNSHHIIPFAVDRLLSLSLDNGITLCKDCHIKIHKLEGKPKEKRFN